jgi:hypothetical protein
VNQLGQQFIDIPPPDYKHSIRYKYYKNEFEKVAKKNKIKVIYRWKNPVVEVVGKDAPGEDGGGNTWMGFLHGGLFHLFEIPNRFENMKDCLQAIDEGFTDTTCDQWRKLKDLGYHSQAEVDTDRGDYGYDQWIGIRSQGYNTADQFDQEKGTEISETGLEMNSELIGSNEGETKNPAIIDVDSFQFDTAIIDGTNIAWGDYEDSPKFKFIISTYNRLRDLGVKPYVVVSAALRHHIDEPIELVEFLKQDDTAEAPANRNDDFFVIQLALRRNAFIVSNDMFKDWKRANPDLANEIDNRRVALTFIEDDPQFDYKLYKLIKRPKRNGK